MSSKGAQPYKCVYPLSLKPPSHSSDKFKKICISASRKQHIFMRLLHELNIFARNISYKKQPWAKKKLQKCTKRRKKSIKHLFIKIFDISLFKTLVKKSRYDIVIAYNPQSFANIRMRSYCRKTGIKYVMQSLLEKE